jgi:hypothetical protein
MRGDRLEVACTYLFANDGVLVPVPEKDVNSWF